MNRSITLAGSCVLFVFASLLPQQASAVPAPDTEYEFAQPDGTKFKARVRGDEHFHWHETADGHPVVRDEKTKEWLYAQQVKGRQMGKTARKVGKETPPAVTFVPEPTAEQLKAMNRKYKRSVPLQVRKKGAKGQVGGAAFAPVPGTSGSPDLAQDGGIGAGPVINSDATVGFLATFLVTFSDRNGQQQTTPQYFEDLLFDLSPGVKSMSNMYSEMSFGKFTANSGPGNINGWYVAPGPHDYYGANDSNGDDMRVAELIEETARGADPSFNFGPYDTDNDGFVDLMVVVHQGTAEAFGGSPTDIWPQQHTLVNAGRQAYETNDLNANGVRVKVNSFFVTSEISNGTTLESATMGVFAHEYGHALGLPDLYDRQGPSKAAGLGDYSLMAGGSNNDDGRTPAWMDAWCRWKMGWVVPNRITSNRKGMKLIDAKIGNEVLFLWNSGVEGPEYFLAEYRLKTGFDAALPGGGLLIYHVDERVTTDNNIQWYVTGTGDSNTLNGHCLIALEQADGLFNLDRVGKNGNSGGVGDPYVPGRTFDDDTIPSSRAYNVLPARGDTGEQTFVAVRNITSAGGEITADIFVTPDRDFPGVAITNPLATLYNQVTEIEGTANDAAGVGSVYVALRENKPGGRWFVWDTGTWGTSDDDLGEHETRAEGKETWSVQIGSTLPDGAYKVWARSYDTGGSESELVSVSFSVQSDTTNPTITIDQPVSSPAYTIPPAAASGTAEDNIREKRIGLYSNALNQWYNWSIPGFDNGTFDFGAHLCVITSGDTDWSCPLPSNLAPGTYQVHAQAVDLNDVGSEWVQVSFTLNYKPTVSVDTPAHNSLGNSVPAISGRAEDKSGTGLLGGSVNFTLYRNGAFWNGGEWQTESVELHALVSASGDWGYPSGSPDAVATLPNDTGTYALSANVIDNAGNGSEPVAGGQPDNNQITFRVDSEPPSCTILSPLAGAVIDTPLASDDWFHGRASDSAGAVAVTLRIKRLDDNTYWTGTRWSADIGDGTFGASFATRDAEVPGSPPSLTDWTFSGRLPRVGGVSTFCMTNGDYEFTAITRDAVGNETEVTANVTVAWNPIFANPPESPSQTAPIAGTGVAAMPGSNFSALAAGDTRSQGAQILRTDAAGNFYVGSGLSSQQTGGYSTINYPSAVIQRLGANAWRNEVPAEAGGWITLAAMEVDAQGNVYAAFEMLTFQQLYYFNSNGDYVYYYGPGRTNRMLVTRFDANGNLLMRRTTQTAEEAVQGDQYLWGTVHSGTGVTDMEIGTDGSVTLLLQNYYPPGDRSAYPGRSQTVVIRITANGTGEFTKFYGYGDVDYDNGYQSTPGALALDAQNNIFFTARESLNLSDPAILNLLRKLSPTGAGLERVEVDKCQFNEEWFGLEADAAGNVYLGATFRVSNTDARQSVSKYDSNLQLLWRGFGPQNTDSALCALELSASGVTVGGNDFGDQQDSANYRWVISRFSTDGALRWSRRNIGGVLTDLVVDAGENVLAKVLLVIGGNYKTSYAKLAANGDLQFVKELAADQQNIVDFILQPNNRAAALANQIDPATGQSTGGAIIDFENPATVLIPVTIFANEPADQSVIEGTDVILSVTNHGSPATAYQWRKHDASNVPQPIPNAVGPQLEIPAAQVTDSGKYSVLVTNASNSAASRTVTLTVYQIVSLAEALDRPELAWTTGGSAEWFGQTGLSYDGVDAATSPPVERYTESWMQTTVTGPGKFSFYWRMAGEMHYDYLHLYLDPTETTNGTFLRSRTGDANWSRQEVTVAAGTHTLRFVCSEGGNGEPNGVPGVDRAAMVDSSVAAEVAITAPANNSTVNTLPAVSGTASSVIETINYTLSRSSDSKFWDGSAWVVETIELPANYDRPAGTWANGGALPPSANGQYSITAIGRDAALIGTNAYSYFTIDNGASLSVGFTFPVNNSTFSDLPDVRGITSHVTTEVTLSIVRLSDNNYWDGAEWVADDSILTTNLDAGTQRWNRTSQLPVPGTTLLSGMYRFTATARDLIGNTVSAVSNATFSAGDTAPLLQTLTITPTTANVTDTYQPLTATLRITDDLTGLYSGELRLKSPGGGRVITSNFYSYNRISGTALDGTYEKTLYLLQYLEPGTWTVELTLLDSTGHSRAYGGTGSPFPAGATSQIEVQNSGLVDNAGPVLASFTMVPSPADVTYAAQIVTVTARVTDDVAGLASGSFSITNPAFNQTFYGNLDDFTRISGTPTDGIYQFTFTIPRFSQPGTWKANLYLTDNGNRSVYYNGSPSNLFPAGISGDLAVVNPGSVDSANPVMDSFALSETSVDVTSAARTVIATIRVTDDVAGLRVGQISVQSPSYQFYYNLDFDNLQRISGTATDGIYSIPIVFPRYVEPGTWQISVSLRDLADRRSYYGGYSTPFPGGAPMTINVVNTGPTDTAGPTISAVSLSTSEVDVATAAQAVTVTVTINDNLSGFGTGSLMFVSPFADPYYPSGPTTPITAAARISGNALGGVYQVTVTIPQNSDPGTWTLGVTLNDEAGNYRTYDSSPYSTPFPAGSEIELNVTSGGSVPPTYNEWIEDAFPPGTPAAATLPGLDFDSDGISNFLEWAFNLSPSVPSTDGLPELNVDSPADVTFAYHRRINSAGLIHYNVIVSDNLADWDRTGSQVEPVGTPVPDPGGITECVTVRLLNSAPARFKFLSVEVTEN